MNKLEVQNEYLEKANLSLGEENAKLYEQIQQVRALCKPILDISGIDKLYGEHLTGKYKLAESIIAIIGDEDD